jgi:protein-S-isoprenylcysteine O-methyltransferase Ste14
MAVIEVLIVACWVIFILVILTGVRFTKRTAERSSRKSRLAYGIPLFFSVFLLINGVGNQNVNRAGIGLPFNYLHISLLPDTVLVPLVGGIVVMLGLFLGLWARITLGSNWSGSVTFKEHHELIQKGPYARVRHPMYSAFLFMYLGTAMFLGTLGGFIGLPLFFLGCWIKLQQEESLMMKHFSEQYTEYRKRVKALIPFLI